MEALVGKFLTNLHHIDKTQALGLQKAKRFNAHQARWSLFFLQDSISPLLIIQELRTPKLMHFTVGFLFQRSQVGREPPIIFLYDRSHDLGHRRIGQRWPEG